MQPLHERQEIHNAPVVWEIVGRRDIYNHGRQMRWLFDSGLPLDQRAIGPPNRSDLARTPRLARQPFDSVEAVRSIAQERFESPLGAEASAHILNGVNIASQSPKVCVQAKIRFIVRGSLQHHGQAAGRATRKVKVEGQSRSIAHWDELFLFDICIPRSRNLTSALQNQAEAATPLFP